jgi:hypothetical protein
VGEWRNPIGAPVGTTAAIEFLIGRLTKTNGAFFDSMNA